MDILLFDCKVMVMVNYSYWMSYRCCGYLWLAIFTIVAQSHQILFELSFCKIVPEIETLQKAL